MVLTLYGDNPNLTTNIFTKNDANPIIYTVFTVIANTAHINILLRHIFIDEKMYPFMVNSTVGSAFGIAPLAMALRRFSLQEGITFGNNNIKEPHKKNRIESVTNPNHHAPIHWGSFGVMLAG